MEKITLQCFVGKTKNNFNLKPICNSSSKPAINNSNATGHNSNATGHNSNAIRLTDPATRFSICQTRIMNYSLKKPNLTWQEYAHATEIYEFADNSLRQKLKAWFYGSEFYNDVKTFKQKFAIDTHPLLKTKILAKKPGFKTSTPGTTIKDYQTKEQYLKTKTNNISQYIGLSWHKIYRIFPSKVSVMDTDVCLEILKIRLCNFVSKNPAKNNNWKSIEYSLRFSNYKRNPILSPTIIDWYNSDLFKTFYDKFIKEFPIPDTHPKLLLKIQFELKSLKAKSLVPSKKEKGLNLYQNNFKDTNSNVLKELNHNLNWMNLIKQEISKIFKDQLKILEFDSFSNHLTKLPVLTDQEKNQEMEAFNKVNSKQEMEIWLKNSKSFSNNLLGWWADLSKNNQSTFQSETHHMVPRYMKNYGVCETKIESNYNFIELPITLHNLIHGVRFLEYGFGEDYLVINRLHSSLHNGKLIEKNHKQTVLELLNNVDLFSEAIRKSKYINLAEPVQQTFAKDMIWCGVINYKIKKIVIPGGSVANYSELLSYLSVYFPNKNSTNPELHISYLRRYLRGQRSLRFTFPFQLINLNDDMSNYLLKVNFEKKWKKSSSSNHYTVWQFKKANSFDTVFIPPCQKFSELTKKLEIYQGFKFSNLSEKKLKLLVKSFKLNGSVDNWTLVQYNENLANIYNA